jgi:GNAT superfamily N-acetyltransferase
MQFRAQAQYYREHYPNTSFDVILLDGHEVGVSRSLDGLECDQMSQGFLRLDVARRSRTNMLAGSEAQPRYVSRWSEEIRIVDIALLPDSCNRGIGTALLRELQAEAQASGKPLRIHVERFNPALKLYERLGFREIEDKGVYLFLEWRDTAKSQIPSSKSQGESVEQSG